MTKSLVKLPPALNEVKGPAADELNRRIVYDDPKHHIRLYQGDCLELLALLPADSIDLIFADLALPTQGLDQYKSLSPRARISSESWGARELYCPRCSSNSLDVLPGNTPVLDYRCPVCSSGFQLKSAASAFRTKLTDGAYSQMRAAILGGRTPNLFLLQYQVSPLSVTSLFFIPDFAFTLSALERRLPLAPTARRAGWIGCNILLNRVPIDACVRLVHEKRAVPAGDVRRAFRKLKPLASLSAEKRGWVLDVLDVVRSLHKKSFELSEVYAFDQYLADLHPNNRHVRDKIRQQLQVLRDMDILTFQGDGHYELIGSPLTIGERPQSRRLPKTVCLRT